MKNEPEFWTEHDDKYGWTHRGDRASPAFREEPLLVFVHGIMGDCLSTWGNTPRFILQSGESPLDLDAFTYHYPSKLHQHASVEAAAEGLAQALRQKFPDHRHYVFFVHSTGGLVIKEMLRREADAWLKEAGNPTTEFKKLDFLTTRTRRIVNLDVPHAGGNKELTGRLYPLYEKCIWPVVRVTKVLLPFLNLGRTEIPRQLVHLNDWVLQLESDFVSAMREADSYKMMRPTSLEVLAADASTVAEYRKIDPEKVGRKNFIFRVDSETLQVRGSHGSFKLPANEHALFSTSFSRRVRAWALSAERLVAEETYSRVQDLMRSVHARGYLGVASAEKDLSFVGDGSRRGNQAQIAHALVRAFGQQGERVRTLLLTGEAGVGKSIAVRLLAREMSLKYLSSDHPVAPLPLVFPLQRVNLADLNVEPMSSPDDPEELWRVIASDWCDFVNKGSGYTGQHPCAVSKDWLDGLFAGNRPIVLIFDAVDEFLTRNLQIDLTTFIQMLDHLRRIGEATNQLTILLCLRSTFSGIEMLVPEPASRFRIRHMDAEEAEQLLPKIGEWLAKLPPHETELAALIRTPLILARLGSHFLANDPASLTKSSILQGVLETILRTTEFHKRTDNAGEETGTTPWIDALALVAWRFYMGARGEMEFTQLHKEIVEAVSEWEAAAAARAENGGTPITPLPGLQLITNEDTLRVLMNQTIFVPTGKDTWRILHDEWAEFLAGRYLSHCLRYAMPSQIDQKACFQSMFRIAGEHLADVTVDDTLVTSFFDYTARHPKGFAAGNFSATLGNSRVGMDDPALGLMFQREAEVGGISRIVLLAGLGMRALRWKEERLIRQLAPHFRNLVQLGRDGKTLPLVASLAWCYLSALQDKDCGPWPGLSLGTPEQERELLLTIVSDVDAAKPGKYRVSPGNRSLQRAFLRIQSLLLHDPFRPISLVHYLYFLCAASYANAAIDEVGKALPGLLASESERVKRIEASGVRELTDAFAACRSLYASNVQTSPPR